MMLLPSVGSTFPLSSLISRFPRLQLVDRQAELTGCSVSCSTVGPQIFIYKTLNLHIARPHPKRAAGAALINAIGARPTPGASFLYRNPPHFYLAFGCRQSSPCHLHVVTASRP